MNLKTTPFTDVHIALGAKMAEFAGYNMPIQYTSIIEEHNNVRNNVGVFDVSHMGEFRAKGPVAKHFMQYVTTNNVEDLFDGKVQYTCLPNGQGGVVDDMLVYRVHDDEYFMVPNAANIDKDWAWMSQIADKMGLEPGKDFCNESEQWAQLAVQGPNALKAMQKLTDTPIEDMEYYTFKTLTFAGVKDIIFSTTGYTGAGGCEIYIPKQGAKKVWDAVFEAGKEFGIMPAGLGCRDTLRLEKGFALYGHEMDDTISPLEAPLGFIVKLKAENNNFINKELLLAQKAAGVKRKVVGFEMLDKGIARNGYEVQDANGNKIGMVRSGSPSPSTGKNIGTALVPAEFSKTGTELFMACGRRVLKAITVKLPFLPMLVALFLMGSIFTSCHKDASNKTEKLAQASTLVQDNENDSTFYSIKVSNGGYSLTKKSSCDSTRDYIIYNNDGNDIAGYGNLILDYSYTIQKVSSNAIMIFCDNDTLLINDIVQKGSVISCKAGETMDAVFSIDIFAPAFKEGNFATDIANCVNQTNTTIGKVSYQLVNFMIQECFSTANKKCSCGKSFNEETVACINAGRKPVARHSPEACTFTCE